MIIMLIYPTLSLEMDISISLKPAIVYNGQQGSTAVVGKGQQSVKKLMEKQPSC